MTNLFDQYVDSLLESTSFLDLPDSPPYGFWISPGGEFFVVSREKHEKVAKEIIKQNPTLKDAYKLEKHKSFYHVHYFLTRRKYIRVVESPFNSNKKYYVDLFAYDPSTDKNISFAPTHSSLKTLKDIAKFYGAELILLND